MKTSSLIIAGAAAYIAYIMIVSKAKKSQPASTNNNRVFAGGGRYPIINFAQDPNSDSRGIQYYNDNPNAQPWDFLSLGYKLP